jgi:hypothetical protein
MSEAHNHRLAIQGARKMISQGERPGYRLRLVDDADGVTWTIEGRASVNGTAPIRRDASGLARVAIAAMLEVPADAFDVDV